MIVLLFCLGTRVYVSLGVSWESRVEGLCGNFDGREDNDFVHNRQFYASNAVEWGNYWKTITSCPDSTLPDDFTPCDVSGQAFCFICD